VKPRDFEPPKPFKIAATYRKDDGQIVSWIDTMGDFLMLESEAVQRSMDSRFLKMVIADPNCSRQEVSESLGIKEWTIRKMSQRLGWTKERTPGSRWERIKTATGKGGLVVVPAQNEGQISGPKAVMGVSAIPINSEPKTLFAV
jgi:hypothetical protein